MNTSKHKTISKTLLLLGTICIIISGAIFFIGGLSYQNPNLGIGELMHPTPLKNYILSFIPSIK